MKIKKGASAINSADILKQIELVLGEANIGIDVIDSKFNIRYIDPCWRKRLGNPAGKKCHLYFMGKKKACPRCGVAAVLKTKMKTVTEETLVKEGNRPIQVLTIPFKDEKGEWLVAEVNIDISERKRLEETLRKGREQYRALAEMAEDPIYVLNREGRITYVNTFGAAYFNKKPAEMIGVCLPGLFKARVKARFMRDIGKVFRSGKSVFAFGEYEFHGSKFWLDTRLSPIIDDSGKVVRVMGISRDVTSHRQAEEVLKRDKRELENLVSSGSQKLLEAQRKLDRISRLADIGRLSATVAHELRSPLAAIGIAAYNIRMKSGDPNLDSNIQNIETKVLESDHIINNLLLYSSVKSPVRGNIKICGLLEECIDLAQSIFPGFSINVRKAFKCPRDLELEADPVQLQEVFNNIINNSCEAFRNKKGKLRVTVSVYKRDRLKITIKDNGIGIKPAALKHIFEPFNSTKSGGTGLGLMVCKQIINLHSGTIDISSVPGKGTAVTVYLPLRIKRAVAGKKQKKGGA